MGVAMSPIRLVFVFSSVIFALSPASVAQEPPDAESMRQFMREQVRQVEEINASNREAARELLQSDQGTSSSAPSAPTARPYSPACMYDTHGNVIHAPPGAECAGPENVALATSEFVAPRIDPEGEWSPVRVGEEALFTLVSRQEAQQSGGPVATEAHEGTQHVAVTREPGKAIEVAVTTRLGQGRGRPDNVERESLFLVPRSGTHYVAAIRTSLSGTERTVRLRSPAKLLPDRIAKGERWSTGAYAVDGLRYQEQGEILGVQTAKTPAGAYEKCLVVRLVGQIEGQLEAAPGVTVTLEGGRVERTQWLARGIGPVLMKEKLTMTMVTPTGQRIATRVTRQAALQGVRGPVPTAPSPKH